MTSNKKLNTIAREHREYLERKVELVWKCAAEIDLAGRFAGLVPKAVFKEIDFSILIMFRTDGYIDTKILLEQIKAYSNGQQSLDIFIEELNIGVEYQGKQHYEAKK